jgi:hypothetical protein
MTALLLSRALATLLEVVVTVGSGAHHAGLGGEVEHVAQRAAVAQGPVQVAGAPAGVVGDGHESGRGGKVPGAGRASSCVISELVSLATAQAKGTPSFAWSG